MQIVLDEGYQFGLGVFETIAVEKGKPVLLSMHLDRMRASIEALGLEQEVSEEEVMEYLRGNRMERGVLKIMASRENKIFTGRENPYTPKMVQRGFRLGYSRVLRNETSPLTFHKTMNYGDCILEKRRGKGEGMDELIFLNTRGELCEGTSTNIFFVQGGRIFTPPISSGLLPGVLRRFLMERFPVEERVIRREEVSQMEECFVTNSLMGIMPAVSLQGQLFHPGPATFQCTQEYTILLAEF